MHCSHVQCLAEAATVAFASAPNFESPADAGTNNVYDVTVTFTDGTNTLSAQTTAITVTDLNDQTPAVTVAATYSQAEAAATTFQAFTMVDSDTTGTYACTLGGTDAADFTASVSGKVCTVVFAANPNYDIPADSDGDNVYDLTVTFTDGTNELSAQTTAITITDVNDQTPAVTVAATYSQAEAAATTFQAFTMVDTDTTGTYACTLGGTDAADFTASVSGKVCTVVFAANPNYDIPADADGDNVYDLTVTFTDGTNELSAQTTAITITDVNDQTPAATVAATYSVAENTATVGTMSITDTDTTGTQACSVAGTDGSLFTCTVSSGTATLAFASAPNYDSAADAGANNVYDVTVSFTDGTNTLSAQTTAITVTDLNDQTPAATVAATYSVAENTVPAASISITDTDTTGTLACSVAGTDSSLFTCTVSSGTAALAFASAPDYETPGDAGTNNVYDITVTFTDGSNTLGAQTTAITVTNEIVTVTDTSATISESASSASSVVTVAATGDASSLTWSITGGNTGSAFSINSATGAISTAAALDHETTASYDLVVSATDGTAADSEAITVTVSDLAIAITASQTGTVAENVATGSSVLTVATTGDSDANDFAITAGNTGSVFAINAATGAITTAASLDFETLASYTLTVTVSDGTTTQTASDVVVTITDSDVTIPSGQSSSVNEDASSGATVMTVSATGDTPSNWVISAGNTGSAFAISSAGVITTAASLDYETTTSYTLTLVAYDSVSSDVADSYNCCKQHQRCS